MNKSQETFNMDAFKRTIPIEKLMFKENRGLGYGGASHLVSSLDIQRLTKTANTSPTPNVITSIT
jgi:hypothetical protein